MGFFHGKNAFTILFIFSICLASSIPQYAAMRPLEGEQWLKKNVGELESLQRGPVTPSGSSKCTHISRNKGGKCPLTEMNVAGRGQVQHAPHAFPNYIVDVAIASVAKETHIQDHDS